MQHVKCEKRKPSANPHECKDNLTQRREGAKTQSERLTYETNLGRARKSALPAN
jgi:hypothetical protein